MKTKYIDGIFHVHSNYSYDGKISLIDLKKECTERNIHFVLLTEHIRGFDNNKLRMLVEECIYLSSETFLVVPGLEFSLDSHKDIHLLAIGLQNLPEDNSLEKIVETTRGGGGLLVVAHPRRNSYFLPDNVVNSIDGIEIWNAAYNSRYLPDTEAIRLLQSINIKNSLHLIGFAGLDLHDRSGLKGLRIRITADYKDTVELLKLIKDSQFSNRGNYLTIPSRSDLSRVSLLFLSLLRMGLTTADSLMWKLRGFKNHNKRKVAT